MGHRYRAADRSPGTDNDAQIPRRPTLRRSRRTSSPRPGRGREGHRSFQDRQPHLPRRKAWASASSRARSRALHQFRKSARARGSRPVTVGIDLGYIKTILSHAAAVHGVVVSTEPIDLARIALGRLGLVGKGDERDRRPTQDELDRIVSALEANIRQQIPVGRVIRFAIATAMRQDEIARVEWRDFDASSRMLLIRNRKDPRKKKGNDQRIPLLDVSGYDACKIIEEQGRFSNIREGRIFPYNGRSVGTAFRRQCRRLKIDDLHFHDLRHEGTSRLFEAGFSIEQVALVTGHKDWKMLRRYTHLKPETLHSIRSVRVA
jgi:Phage integrase family